MRIVEAIGPAEIAAVRVLFEEYWESSGFTPCFQGFEQEVASLPGKYSRLGLLLVEEQPAGCVALRPLDDTRGEFKRLYVRPQYRGRGIGQVLLDWIIGQARAAGYTELVADTMPQMATALAMYERAGFEKTGPYGSDPTPGAVYLRLKL
jgi:ribosomal protein S18 acetylase RimI-like enzyme